MVDGDKGDEFPDDPEYQWGDGLDDGGDKASDEPDPLPVSQMPDIPEEDKPTEDELADWDADEEEDAEEEAILQSSTSRSLVLPGAKGPLEVDSIGDYLEDFDFSQVDADARAMAEQGYEMLQASQEAGAEEASRVQRIRQWHADKKRGRPVPAGGKPNRPPDWLIAGEETPEQEAPEQEAPEQGVNPDRVQFTRGHGGWRHRRNPARIRSKDPNGEAEGMLRVPPEDSLPGPSFKLVPGTGPGDAEHLAAQQTVPMADIGVQGPSSYQLKGQSETAVQEAIDQSSDAIKTVSAAVVDTLKGLASTLNEHHDAIQTLRDIVASSGEEDVR